ncbi:SMI1/KNR4 family protein [Nocardia camponoti]|nr:SMI1/KNR4 family protein [Nocardia camponoti]
MKGNENAHIWVGWTHGFIRLGIETASTAPIIDVDEWETIDEGVIELGPVAALTRTTLSPIRPPELDLLASLPAGLHRIRVAARGRDDNSNDVAILIQLWPTSERTSVTEIKHDDGFDVREYERNFSRRRRHPDPDGLVVATPSDVSVAAPRTPASPTAPTSLAGQWERLHEVIGGQSPVAWGDLVNRPALPQSIADAEQRTLAWPPELREWFALHNGGGSADLLPGTSLLSLDQMLEVHAMESEVWGELAEENAGIASAITEDAPASSEAGQFIPAFIPIAERDGTMLVCDTRPGPLHGCVTEFGKDTADSYPPTWASLSAMLTDLTTSIATGSPFNAQYQPELGPSGLNWVWPTTR